MLYTVTTYFKLERLYHITEQIEAKTPVEAKKIALSMVLASNPEATNIRQRTQKSHRDSL